MTEIRAEFSENFSESAWHKRMENLKISLMEKNGENKH